MQLPSLALTSRSSFNRREGPFPENVSRDGLKVDLGVAKDLNGIFSIVRKAVKQVLGIERAGLSLALSNLPPNIGAYWQVTGNVIVMNETIYRGIRSVVQSREEANAFTFVILAHEYLHALGYWGEDEVRVVTLKVAQAAFGPDHIAAKLAGSNLWEYYPFLNLLPNGKGEHLRFVTRFDRDVTDNYIR